MSKFKRYLASAIILSLQVGFFGLWQFGGLEPAGNIFRGMVATLAALQIVACLYYISQEKQIDPDRKEDGWQAFVVVTKMLMLLYVGSFWLYGWYMIAVILGVVRIMENRNRIEAQDFADEEAAAASIQTAKQ